MNRLLFLFFTSLIAFSAAALELKTAAQNSAPKYFLDKNGEMAGLCVDIIQAIEIVQPEITITGTENFLPFLRIQHYLETEQLDAFFGMAKNDSRLQKYRFLEPALYEMSYVLAVRQDDDIEAFDSLDRIAQLNEENTVLSISGTAASRFIKNIKGIEVDHSAQTVDQMLSMLLAKRGRFAFYHDLGLSTAIKARNLEEDIRLLPVKFYTYNHFAAVPLNADPESVERLTKALESLHQQGRLQAIRDQY